MDDPVVQREQLCNGIAALTQYVAKKENKSSILGDGSKIHLTMCMKKIPALGNLQSVDLEGKEHVIHNGS